MKILIVDDKEENRYLLKALLRGNGHEPTTAENGAEALERLKSGGFELIISDILMPVMDGFQLCRKVKTDETLRHIPFIVYTATYTGPQDEAFAMKIGADRFIQKPCEPDKFMEAVREVMAAAGSGDIASTQAPMQEEEMLKLYSERLVRKIEQKMLELEKEVQARREVEQTLRASERKYRLLAEHTLDIIWAMDPGLAFTYVNPAIESLMGYSPEEFIGSRLPDHCDEENFAKIIRVIQDEMARGPNSSGVVLEAVLLKKSREPIPVEIHGRVIYSETGEPMGLQGTARDISENKKAEERIRHLNCVIRGIRNVNQLIIREKDRYRLIQAACENLVATRGFNSAWIVIRDESGRHLRTGESGLGDRFSQLKEMFKLGRVPRCGKEALLRSGITVIEDPSVFCNDCLLNSCHSGRAIFCTRLEYGGRVYGFFTTSVPGDFCQDQEEQGLFKEIGEDISFALYNIEREKARKETKRRLNEAYEIITMSPAVVFLWKNDKGWPVEFVTENVQNLLGYTAEEFMSQKISYSATVYPEDMERVAGEVSKYSREKGRNQFVHSPYRIVTKEGKIRWVDDRTYIRRNEKGVITHYQGIVINITEVKELEMQLLQSQKLEAVGRLAGGIAHDFNNLLTAIIGNSEMAIIDFGGEAPIREVLEEIKEAGERAAKLTRQLLAFSRKQILHPEVLNLNRIVVEMDKMLQRLIGEDINLKTILSPDLGRIEADVGQLEQILMNLAVNAKDAMPKGGRLTIETKNVMLDEDYAHSHISVRPGPYVMLAVSDTGVGMSDEVQAQIFEPFFTTKEKGKGTGLGLSTVYGIVKQSGGNIWVYSEIGKGTAFKIYFPRVDAAESGRKKAETEKESLRGTETVLLVEDDKVVKNLVLKSLKRFGYTVLTAGDGEEALSIASAYEGAIHLLLTDIVMPKISGKDLADRLRDPRPELRVLFMSGYTDNSVVHHGILDKGAVFLQKPFTPEGLARKVRKAMGD